MTEKTESEIFEIIPLNFEGEQLYSLIKDSLKRRGYWLDRYELAVRSVADSGARVVEILAEMAPDFELLQELPDGRLEIHPLIEILGYRVESFREITEMIQVGDADPELLAADYLPINGGKDTGEC